MFIRSAWFGLCALGLVGCVASGGQETSSAAQKVEVSSPESYKSEGFAEYSYKASGKTYTLFVAQKARGSFGMDKVHISVRSGAPFTATSSDDAEVQNTVRDAYRALKLCPANSHPGIVNFAYAPVIIGDVPTWNVYLRCTDKAQKNI